MWLFSSIFEKVLKGKGNEEEQKSEEVNNVKRFMFWSDTNVS